MYIPAKPQYSRKMKIHKYECLEKLGNGRFGSVYKGQHESTGKSVAIKLEPLQQIQTIKHETIILNYLHSKTCDHIPKIHWFGVFDHTMCLVMTYYDCSLYDYMMNRPSMSTSDILHIIQFVLHALKSIHESGVVHRDIKPQNIMITRNKAVLIDFGMATFYIDENSQHTPELQPLKENLLGTLKYMSYYIHLGKPYSRRDDLLSLAYVYMWLMGMLYWSSSDSPLRSDSPLVRYSDTHILHPKNQYIKGQKELGRIREYFHTLSNIDSEDSQKTDELSLRSIPETTKRKCLWESKEYEKTPENEVHRSLLVVFVEYVYGLTFYETPRYTIPT